MNLNFQPFPELSSDKVVLRKITEDDAERLFYIRTHPVVIKYLDRDPDVDVEQVRQLIKRINDAVDTGQGITWAVTARGNDEIIGTIGFWRMTPEHFRAEIGYMMDPAFHGKGLASEAMKLALDHGFDHINIHSVEANVNPLNSDSIKLLERHRFVREAYFRENFYYNGHFFDSAIYCLLQQDHQRKK